MVTIWLSATCTTRSPSGANAGSNSWPASSVHWVSWPVATSTDQMSYVPPRSEENTISSPSGDQRGSRSSKPPEVTWVGSEPSGSAVHTWNRPSA